MTRLSPLASHKLSLFIELESCVGCHACAIACKE